MRKLTAALMMIGIVCFSALGLSTVKAATKAAAWPENLALKAQAQASSEHNSSYLAKFAVDGKVPVAGSQEDLGQAWCVQGATYRHGAEFTLQWPEPVTIAEIVYYGRTAWFAEECWKDYEVYADLSTTPAAKGQMQMGHGPQRIKLTPPPHPPN